MWTYDNAALNPGVNVIVKPNLDASSVLQKPENQVLRVEEVLETDRRKVELAPYVVCDKW